MSIRLVCSGSGWCGLDCPGVEHAFTHQPRPSTPRPRAEALDILVGLAALMLSPPAEVFTEDQLVAEMKELAGGRASEQELRQAIRGCREVVAVEGGYRLR